VKRGPFLYILSGNLSTTPRALKSILSIGPNVCDIILVSRSEFWEMQDKEIINEHNLKVLSLPLWRKNFLPWFSHSIAFYFSRFLYPIHRKSLKLNAQASEKSSLLLNSALLRHGSDTEYEIVMAHSYGSLYPAWRYSRKKKIPFIFDMEDYHPEEDISTKNANEKVRREYLLKRILPEAYSVSFASPLIAKNTLRILKKELQYTVILNSFPEKEFIPPLKKSGPLRMVWFSQNIASSRGLEIFFESLKRLKNEEWNLTLIGNHKTEFYLQIPESIRERISIYTAMRQNDLHGTLAQYDVGLALEINRDNLNRDICLTNKIFAYAQAGLYILATETSAQRQFIASLGEISGTINPAPSKDFVFTLEKILSNLTLIRSGADSRYQQAKSLSWENEKNKLFKILPKERVEKNG
jgi:hypothetical protein